jgi:Holliday junction resolvasome RuvABC endonuclease subunit
MKIKVLGMDISLNHGAIIELTGGKLSNFWYWTDLAGAANKSKRGYRLDPQIQKIKDKQLKSVKRLAWIKGLISVSLKSGCSYAGIEDYALTAEQGAHQLGEVGGLARLMCYEHHVKVRLHDPLSIKMFATHDGSCQKDAVRRAVTERWGVDFSSLDQPAPTPTLSRPNPKQNTITSEDMSDAFAVAQLVWTEVLLRAGKITMEMLHEKEIRVFNRTTKTYPVNLLSREWISQ